MNGNTWQKCMAGLLSWACLSPAATTDQFLQQLSPIAASKADVPSFIRPYFAPNVPPIRLANSPRLGELVRAGKLYLTVQDAIALALENNIDLEVARYNPIVDEWNVTRAQAGGALPGVPSGSSQTSFVQSGQGVAGAQQDAGVSTSSRTGNGNTSNATISQVGSVTQNLDPLIQDSTAFTHRSEPQANTSFGVVNLIQGQRAYTASLQQGFLTGGSVHLTYSNSYLNENSPSDSLNPSVAPLLTLQLQQSLLRGFGVAVNSRTIVAAQRTLESDPVSFRAQVITVVANVLDLYYGLVADYQDVRAKQSALDAAQQFYENNKKQVQLGALAPLDVTTAEAQVASSEQDLVVSQTNLQQQEVQLKNVLSRTGLTDPVLANVQIIPLDHIVVPENDSLPPLKDLIAQAMKSRTDVALQKVALANAKTSALNTQNGVRPNLTGVANFSQRGISGTKNPLSRRTPDPYFVGGMNNALGQVFRRNFPTESAGLFFSASLRNRQAQADYGYDQLQLRQTELTDQKNLNQIAVDVSNQVITLQQARARYEAAVKNRVLQQQLLSAEQKKFALGASTPYNVVVQQRDLSTAQSTEISDLVAYSTAKVALDQALGTTLEENNVSLQESAAGHVNRTSTLPAVLPKEP